MTRAGDHTPICLASLRITATGISDAQSIYDVAESPLWATIASGLKGALTQPHRFTIS